MTTRKIKSKPKVKLPEEIVGYDPDVNHETVLAGLKFHLNTNTETMVIVSHHINSMQTVAMAHRSECSLEAINKIDKLCDRIKFLLKGVHLKVSQ